MRISDVLRVKGTQVVTVTPDTTVRRLLASRRSADLKFSKDDMLPLSNIARAAALERSNAPTCKRKIGL